MRAVTLGSAEEGWTPGSWGQQVRASSAAPPREGAGGGLQSPAPAVSAGCVLQAALIEKLISRLEFLSIKRSEIDLNT